MLTTSELETLANLFASDLKMADNSEAAGSQGPVPMAETPPVPVTVTAEQVDARLSLFSRDCVRKVD